MIAQLRVAADVCELARHPDGYPDWVDDGWIVQPERWENTQAVSLRNADDLIIAYAGSNDKADWLENGRFRQRRTRMLASGRAHRGFVRHYERSATWVAGHVRSALDAGKRISFYGHSLGGATAMLAALDAYHLGARPNVITFGSPRWCSPSGSMAYDKALGQSTTRVISVGEDGRHDLVPRLLPRWSGLWLYRHVGDVAVVYHDRPAEFGAPAWNALRGLVPGVWPWQVRRILERLRGSVDAHGIEIYQQNLGQS